MGNPIELNRYVYTANNPVNYVDPSGYSLVSYVFGHLKSALAGPAMRYVANKFAEGAVASAIGFVSATVFAAATFTLFSRNLYEIPRPWYEIFSTNLRKLWSQSGVGMNFLMSSIVGGVSNVAAGFLEKGADNLMGRTFAPAEIDFVVMLLQFLSNSFFELAGSYISAVIQLVTDDIHSLDEMVREFNMDIMLGLTTAPAGALIGGLLSNYDGFVQFGSVRLPVRSIAIGFLHGIKNMVFTIIDDTDYQEFR